MAPVRTWANDSNVTGGQGVANSNPVSPTVSPTGKPQVRGRCRRNPERSLTAFRAGWTTISRPLLAQDSTQRVGALGDLLAVRLLRPISPRARTRGSRPPYMALSRAFSGAVTQGRGFCRASVAPSGPGWPQ